MTNEPWRERWGRWWRDGSWRNWLKLTAADQGTAAAGLPNRLRWERRWGWWCGTRGKRYVKELASARQQAPPIGLLVEALNPDRRGGRDHQRD